MLEPVVKRSYSYAFPIGNTPLSVNQQLNFQYIPMLDKAYIYSIQVYVIPYVVDLSTGGQSYQNLTLSGMTLTMVQGDESIIFNQPLTDFNIANTTSYKRLIKPTQFNLPKSYITITNTSVFTIGSNYGILFNFIYHL